MLGLQAYLGGAFRHFDHEKASPRPQPPRPGDQVLVDRRQYVPADRTLEWVSAYTMVAIAVVFAIPGDTLVRTSLAPLRNYGIGEAMLCFVYGGFGMMRGLALWINGRRTRTTAIVRVVTAVVSALFWANYAAVILLNGIYVTGVASVGMATIPVFAFLDFMAVGRAWRDAKYRTQ